MVSTLLLVSAVIFVETGVRISVGSCVTNESMTVSISGLCKLAGPLRFVLPPGFLPAPFLHK